MAVEPANCPIISQRRAGQHVKPGNHTIQGIGAILPGLGERYLSTLLLAE